MFKNLLPVEMSDIAAKLGQVYDVIEVRVN